MRDIVVWISNTSEYCIKGCVRYNLLFNHLGNFTVSLVKVRLHRVKRNLYSPVWDKIWK